MYKLKDKTIIIWFVCICLIFAAEPKTISQVVRNWPGSYDATGAHWFTYDLADCENRVNTEASYDCYTSHVPGLILWSSQMANFGDFPSWGRGDNILSFGSWDSAYAASPGTYGDNINHTGFYWLFTDTLTTEDPQEWRDDTLRPLPKPIASQVGGTTGDILISITNPAETRYTGQTVYDVMGYWIWADTTSGTHHDTAGRPDYFDLKVGFFSVDGDPGEITICTHSVSIYRGEQTVYWAYKLVARPDTVDDPEEIMGYSTYYFSQNSDPLVIIGIEENTNLKPGCMQLEISPNPFTDRTDITYSMGQGVKSTELKIFDVSGQLIRDFPIDLCNHNKSVKSVRWYGTDESGKLLPSGVYFVQAKGGDLNLTKKVILQR